MTSQFWKSCALIAITAAFLGGCVSSREGNPTDYFLNFAFEPPKGDVVTVCHGYGCRIKTPFSIQESDIQHIRGIMGEFEGSSEAELNGVQKVISYLERRVGKAIGTDKDRAKIETRGINNPSQQDCIDEATNTTSYLMVLARHGLLQYHTVRRPEVRGYWVDGKWPHWTAVLQNQDNNEEWAVDTWFRDNGVPPVVIPLADWYKFD
ncbi:MAG: hypothetical protein K8F25_00990, partial [Fimbriimonadaceae bacterium]|nr:hypothetical protein [Alphaproteobacteria bacterium]